MEAKDGIFIHIFPHVNFNTTFHHPLYISSPQLPQNLAQHMSSKRHHEIFQVIPTNVSPLAFYFHSRHFHIIVLEVIHSARQDSFNKTYEILELAPGFS